MVIWVKLLFLLEYAHVIHLHCDRQRVLVNALCATPVTTPSEVEDDVEGVIIGPVVAAQATVVVGQLKFAVDIGGDVLAGPLDGIGVEFALGALAVHLVGHLGAVGVDMSSSVKARRYKVGS